MMLWGIFGGKRKIHSGLSALHPHPLPRASFAPSLCGQAAPITNPAQFGTLTKE